MNQVNLESSSNDVGSINFEKYHQIISNIHLSKDSGKVREVVGMIIKGYLPGAAVGSIVEIFPNGLEKSFLAEVVGFKDKDVLMMPLDDMRGVGLGSRIILSKQIATIRVGKDLIGRVVDGLGKPLDGLPAIEEFEERSLYAEVVNPLLRKPIHQPLDLGVRAINSCLTVGVGQRVAIMAGSGVGKSVLLGMMARYTNADVNVIALIGERGREVREFIENDLGPEGMKKSIVVCVTSDQSPLIRMRGAYVATAIAEYFCGLGKNVLLMMDSITRFAMAQREIGLSTGEPPSSKGYTPSVFAQLPKLLERAGNFENQGSITGLYTTLVEGDDMNDPIGDSVRSIVDGHIVLSRQLAQKGHFPSIDVLASASRVMKNVTQSEHQKLAQKLRETLAVYKDAEDLINIGAYKAGANPKIDKAVKLIDPVIDFLRQRVEDGTNYSQTLRSLQQIFIGQ
ncbi:MAG: FliI/YscN family ATPase [Bdellovibrionaceae bacterium]|nr:FliI/YscN family ATPase [Pseudobdellovibrionaceae bacterium]NUM59400.1 FliI/YscN family ATPase [Pseudobdellovibrionaceae bacterium]